MKVIPSLTEQGWVTDSRKILNKIMSYYILTDNAQSLIFQGELVNLSNTYHTNINNPTGMSYQMKADLDKVLSRYFNSVDVTTEAKQITETRYSILLYVSVMTEDNARIELSKVVELDSDGFKKVIDTSNYGQAKSVLDSIH